MRAFAAGPRFLNMFLDHNNENVRAYFIYLGASRWLGYVFFIFGFPTVIHNAAFSLFARRACSLRLDALAATFIAIVTFASVASRGTISVRTRFCCIIALAVAFG